MPRKTKKKQQEFSDLTQSQVEQLEEAFELFDTLKSGL